MIFGKDLQNSLEQNCDKVVLKLTLQRKSSKEGFYGNFFRTLELFRNNCSLDHLHKATSLPSFNADLIFSFISLDVLGPWEKLIQDFRCTHFISASQQCATFSFKSNRKFRYNKKWRPRNPQVKYYLMAYNVT